MSKTFEERVQEFTEKWEKEHKTATESINKEFFKINFDEFLAGLNFEPNPFSSRFTGDFSGKNEWQSAWTGPGEHQKPIFHQCLKDAKEYFNSQGWNLEDVNERKKYPSHVKERIFGFLKKRKKYYEENGLLIINEKGGGE